MNRKIYKISKAGSIKNLRLRKDQLTDPTENDVQIQIKSIGLNFADIFALTGLYSATPRGAFIPGLEYSGVILKMGDKVKGFHVGDPVMGVIRFGAYASHINVSHQYIFPLPNGWSFSEGAAFPVNYLTAYYALIFLGGLKEKQRVLIHSAAGGVGIMANRIARKFGAITVGTVGDQQKTRLIEKENYNSIIVRGKNLRNELAELTDNSGYGLILDGIGDKVFRISYDLLAPQGKIITFGAATFTPANDRPNYFKLIYKYLTRPKIDPLEMVSANKSVMGFNLIWLWDKSEYMRIAMHESVDLDLGPPVIGERFSFAELPDAVRRLRTGKTVGKLVIELE